MSPTSSQMQKVEPSRIVSCGTSAPGDPHRARLGQRLDDELVDVDVAGTRDREENAFGHVFGAEWVDAFVWRLRLLLVATEANAGEIRLDEPGIDGGHPNRPAEQVLAERVGEAAHGELRRDVDRRVLVSLAPGDRAHVDDVPAVAEVRQAEAGDADQPVDVRLQHCLLILFASLPKGVAAETKAGVVDEDVQCAELPDRVPDEPLATFRSGDVELELDLGFELLDAPRPAGHTGAFACDGGRRGCADPARGAGDDRGLSVKQGHEAAETSSRPLAEPRSAGGKASLPPPRRTLA